MTPILTGLITVLILPLGVFACPRNQEAVQISQCSSLNDAFKRANLQQDEQQDARNLQVAHTVCSASNDRQLMVTMVPYRKFPFLLENIDPSRGGFHVNIYCSKPIALENYIRQAVSSTAREEGDMLIYKLPYSTDLYVPKFGKEFFGECLMATYPPDDPNKLCNITVWLGIGKSVETGEGLVAKYGLNYSIRTHIPDINMTLQGYFASLSNTPLHDP